MRVEEALGDVERELRNAEEERILRAMDEAESRQRAIAARAEMALRDTQYDLG